MYSQIVPYHGIVPSIGWGVDCGQCLMRNCSIHPHFQNGRRYSRQWQWSNGTSNMVQASTGKFYGLRTLHPMIRHLWIWWRQNCSGLTSVGQRARETQSIDTQSGQQCSSKSSYKRKEGFNEIMEHGFNIFVRIFPFFGKTIPLPQ